MDDGNNRVQVFNITTSTSGSGNSGGGNGDGEGDGVLTEFASGFFITEYINFGVLFGAFAVFEVVIPNLKQRREIPTRLNAVNKTPDKKTNR